MVGPCFHQCTELRTSPRPCSGATWTNRTMENDGKMAIEISEIVDLYIGVMLKWWNMLYIYRNFRNCFHGGSFYGVMLIMLNYQKVPWKAHDLQIKKGICCHMLQPDTTWTSYARNSAKTVMDLTLLLSWNQSHTEDIARGFSQPKWIKMAI